jgi:thioesterase domain-containing protein
VREVFALAEAAYLPLKLLRTRAVIYRATQGEDGDRPLLEILADPLFGWQEYLVHVAETVDVPGGHGTLLREPHVAAIASRLCVSFARVDGSRRDSADSA